MLATRSLLAWAKTGRISFGSRALEEANRLAVLFATGAGLAFFLALLFYLAGQSD